MDKVKAQATVLADKAQTGVQQGQTKIQEMQAAKQVDHQLRELGAYVFLSERGRVQPDSDDKVAGIMGELDGLEQAGTPVTITSQPYPAPGAGAAPPSGATPDGGAVPQSGAVPPAGVPTPSEAGPPAAGGAIPQSGSAIPQSGSAIPQSGGGLPGQ